MTTIVLRPSQTALVDPSEKVVIPFNWDTANLATGVSISSSTFILTPLHPLRYVLSITRVTTTATVTTGEMDDDGTIVVAAHGLTTGQYVSHVGAVQSDYNVTAQITVLTASTYTFTVSGSPASPATGTIQYLGPSLTKDNPSILAGSRRTQVRLDGTTAALGQVYELANNIATDETPSQIKEQSIRILIQNK